MRKISAYVLALTFVVVSSKAVIPAQFNQLWFEKNVASNSTESSTSSQEPDIFGYFYIKGKAPKGFADFDFLQLGGNGEYGAGANPPDYGTIMLKERSARIATVNYPLLKPTLNGKNFSFKTKTVGGVGYEFDGVFSRMDFSNVETQPQGKVVLTGTLKKKKAGKIIAQSKVAFRWELGD